METPQKNLSKLWHGKSEQKALCDILNAYKTHPSIKQIERKLNEQNFFRKEKLFFKAATSQEIENLINCLDTNKAAGIDTIQLKHIKIVDDDLTPLLTVAINKSMGENIFRDSAKIASVIPLDKGKPNKNSFQIIDLLVFQIHSQSFTKESLKKKN